MSYKSTVILFLIIATKSVALHSVKKTRSDKMKRATNLSRYNFSTLQDCTRIIGSKRLYKDKSTKKATYLSTVISTGSCNSLILLAPQVAETPHPAATAS